MGGNEPHIVHSVIATATSPAPGGIPGGEGGLSPALRGHGPGAQGDARRRVVSVAHGTHLLQLVESVLHRGDPQGRRGD